MYLTDGMVYHEGIRCGVGLSSGDGGGRASRSCGSFRDGQRHRVQDSLHALRQSLAGSQDVLWPPCITERYPPQVGGA